MKNIMFVAITTFVNLSCILGFGIWSILRPQFPDTLWLGKGCINVQTVSNNRVLPDIEAITESYTTLLKSTSVDLDEIVLRPYNGSIQIDVTGFLKAKTPTAARVIFSDAIKDLEAGTSEFKYLGVFAPTNCGLEIRLPVNAPPTNTELPVNTTDSNEF
jgi:hypothetical protein